MSSVESDAGSLGFTPRAAQSSTIRKKLLHSHLLIAGLGACLLLASLVTTIWMRAITVHLAEAHGASEYLSMRVLSGLHRSEAALRDWVVSGNPNFPRQRKAAWYEEIHPALEALQSLSLDWDPGERQLVSRLVGTLKDLQDAQWWVEDVARTPGNEPARDALRHDMDPLATALIATVTELININKNPLADRDPGPLLGNAADFRWMFTYANARFREFAASGDPMVRAEFVNSFEAASRIHQRSLRV